MSHLLGRIGEIDAIMRRMLICARIKARRPAAGAQREGQALFVPGQQPQVNYAFNWKSTEWNY